jgi:hypothetical protein
LAITLSGQYILKDGNWRFMVAALIIAANAPLTGLPTVFLFAGRLLVTVVFVSQQSKKTEAAS